MYRKANPYRAEPLPKGLSDAACRAAKAIGRAYRLPDGRSLFLAVSANGVRSWQYVYKSAGRLVTVTLGRYPGMGLADARAERDRLALLRRDGMDPRAQKAINAAQERAKLAELERAKSSTFESIAREWMKAASPTWGERHRLQVEQCLNDHVNPRIGSMPVGEIKPGDVLAALETLIRDGRAETARRAYQRISAALEHAALHGHVEFNAASACKREVSRRLKGVLRTNPKRNFPCVSLAEAPELMRAIASLKSNTSAKSLTLFVALTACRTGEARHAKWDELDLKGAKWAIQAERMKARRPHYFDLSPEVIALLRAQRKRVPKSCPFVFPHQWDAELPASENAVLEVLDAAGFVGRMSGHGFRALFSTGANESGEHRREVIEAHLAHAVGGAVERSYNRAGFESERRALAHWWASQVSNWCRA
jgi:integrase